MTADRIRPVLALLAVAALAAADPLAAAIRQPSGERPELLMRPATAAALRGLHRQDGLRGRLAARIVGEATAMAALPLPERRLQGRRLLSVSRTVLRRVLSSAMAWHLTGEGIHLDTARRTMRAAAGFADWNPGHFLDVAEMTAALAIGVDWLDRELPADDRAAIRAAIRELGLRPGDGGGWWVRAENNWNQVCHGGLVLGALVLRDQDPELAERIIRRAIAEAPRGLAAYAPDGVYPEGPSYWAYGTTYTVLMLDALEGALGGDAGLSRSPGLLASARFLVHATGPTGRLFNYSDGGTTGDGLDPALGWLARRLDEPSLLAGAWAGLPGLLARPVSASGEGRRCLPLTLLWAGDPVPPAAQALPTSWSGGGRVPVAMHRSGWDADATWVGIKAGTPAASHGHMDAGSVVVEAKGLRWVTDLGKEEYGLLESAGVRLWDATQDGGRWSVLRHHVRSHATLMVDGLGQIVAGSAAIERSILAGPERTTVIDLGPVYAGQLRQVRRGVRLTALAGIVVRDEFAAEPGRQVRSAVVTPATPVALAPDLVRLDQDGQSMWLRLDLPAGAAWTVHALEPERAVERPNPGIRLLAATVEGNGAAQVMQWSLHRELPTPTREEPLASW